MEQDLKQCEKSNKIAVTLEGSKKNLHLFFMKESKMTLMSKHVFNSVQLSRVQKRLHLLALSPSVSHFPITLCSKALLRTAQQPSYKPVISQRIE
ncbi:hypothetical protein Tcan_14404 [Toxocara canis]|uniref:Uncharacterized protein n=1 Tax=Toxocara canis TaxID=6265 RepID=A0A0B2VPZ0_TOXCA|nr:hypothetical protein Tcan_14404 [Toxocara canis]